MNIETLKKNLRKNPVLIHLVNEKLTDRQKVIITFLDSLHGGLPPYDALSFSEISECIGISENIIRNEIIHLIQVGEIMEHWVVLE